MSGILARERLADFIAAAHESGSVLDEDGEERRLSPVTLPRHSAEAIRDLAVREGATKTIEIGLALGISALYLCDALLASGAHDVQHVATDPLQADSWGNAGLRTLRASGADSMVEFHAEWSQLLLPSLLRDHYGKFDLALIDGDHRFDGVFLDLYYCCFLVRAGGIIVLDDAWMPSVRLAIAYAQTNLQLELIPGVMGPDEFSWASRPTRLLPRRRKVSSGVLAALRTPTDPTPREWDSHVDFTWAARGGAAR